MARDRARTGLLDRVASGACTGRGRWSSSTPTRFQRRGTGRHLTYPGCCHPVTSTPRARPLRRTIRLVRSCPFAVQFSRRCVDARDLRAGCATVRKSEGDEVSAFKPANANPGAMNDMRIVIALLKNTDAYRSGMHMAPNAVPVVVDRPTLVGDEVDRCITVQTQLSHPYSSSDCAVSIAEESSRDVVARRGVAGRVRHAGALGRRR
jgi:hypothetical protein